MQEFNLHRANLLFLFTSILEEFQKLSKMSLKGRNSSRREISRFGQVYPIPI